MIFLLFGCASTQLSQLRELTPGDHKLYMDFKGLKRTYILHLPPSYDRKKPLPLIIVLHGWMSSGKGIEETTGMSGQADEKDFIVAYPDGTGFITTSWNAGFCCGNSMIEDIDDVGFIKSLIEIISSRLAVDRKRIYAAGFSNGGMMAYRLGGELPDVFAAIAPVSATIGGKMAEEAPFYRIPEPSKPVSLIAFHGLKDYHVPFGGGHGRRSNSGAYYLSVNDSISFWARADNCSVLPKKETSNDGNIIRETYSCSEKGIEVVLYTIMDGGHKWPMLTEETDKQKKGVSATDIIVDFFLSHPKR